MGTRTLMMLFLLGIGVFLTATIGMFVFQGKKPTILPIAKQTLSAGVSGTFNINGTIPPGATISLTQKDILSDQAPVVFASGITPLDSDVWNFTGAVSGKAYEIQANLMQNGEMIAQSSPLDVSAPADEETLVLNVESEKNTPNAIISGNIVVNGYIPPNATITIQGRDLGEQQFTNIAKGLPGQARQFMSYTTASSGITYEVVGTLLGSDGTNLGTSSTLTVTAPALNETLTINSLAAAPIIPSPTPTATPLPSAPTATPVINTPTPTPKQQPVAISGSINFNGAALPNSRIVVYQKVYNTQNYQVAVDNIQPIDNVTWVWNQPQQSTWYDMIAVLKQKQNDGTDKDISTSSMTSVAAPATNVSFTLNSSFSLSAPGGPISIACGNLSGATWNATLTLGSVNGAQSYWYQVGTSNGGIQVMNSTQNASGNDAVSVNMQMSNGTTYFVRYAYATLPNLNANSTQFSPFTNTSQIRCNQ